MGSLIVVTGPPGAGKSTVARVLAIAYERSVLVEGDAFFAFLERGAIPPWLPESAAQNEVVIQAAATAAGQYATGGYDTVYDGVVGPWFLPTFVAATGLASLHYAVLLPSVDECIARVANREGHGFTDPDATARMHEQFARADVDERHVFVDPTGSAGDVAERIRTAVVRESIRYELRG